VLEEIVARWYVVYTLSGSEKRIKQMILEQVAKHSMSEFFEDIVVPTIEVSGIKRGKTVILEKKFMPGYVLIKMKMTPESWHFVKNITKIGGFLGGKLSPKALTDKEAEAIFKGLEAEEIGAKNAKLYEIGQGVVVTDGPFETFVGIVEDVDYEKSKMRVSISIFGKATLIELGFAQVKKNV
jgi:transcriptional antiterminator NusG